jgi:hypothetical protein
MCYGLTGLTDEKDGQIAHLDRDPHNNEINNLAYLCLECHKRYDRKSNRVLGFTAGEITFYRSKLYRALGHDRIEWTITVRADQSQYSIVKEYVDRAQEILRNAGLDVLRSETPIG